ncbi:MAG: hemerythrin domain-containing protein [Candidatus Obscuribacterales bacterium]
MKDVVKQVNEAIGSGMAQLQEYMSNDAVKLLKMDHRKVKGMFIAFKLATEHETKVSVVQQICLELKVHSQLEEEMVYPQLRMIENGPMLTDEADVEHRLVKEIIDELEQSPYKGSMFEAKVKVLQDLVEHHIKEEEHQLLPKLKDVADLEMLAKELQQRKAELMHEMLHPRKARTAKSAATGAPKTDATTAAQTAAKSDATTAAAKPAARTRRTRKAS